MSYQCPLCRQPLQQTGRQWSCGRHVFDCAKEGYVNLLPVQFKRSLHPGDNAEMMQARRRFLDEGHYQPLREHLIHCIDAVLAENATALLDIGCGEGYYTGALAAHLGKTRSLRVYGLDIAKTAVQRAARRYGGVAFCVASSRRLPFAASSLDAILKIYAPCNEDELQRTVNAGGWVITVSPGPRHLWQLKAEVYDEVRLHPSKPENLNGFTLVKETSLAYDMTLSGAQAAALLQMTPFAWRASEAVGRRLHAAEWLVCETDFVIRLHQRQQA